MTMFYETFMSKLDLRFMKYHALSNLCLLRYLWIWIYVMMFELLSFDKIYFGNIMFMILCAYLVDIHLYMSLGG